MKTLALKPRMSEKAYANSQTLNTYVFDVPTSANKTIVSTAVAEQFKVTVEDVRLTVVKGKSKRAYKRRARPVDGKRPDTKKAYVRLKTGDKIAIFEAAEEPKETVMSKAVKKANEKATAKAAKEAEKIEKAETPKKGGRLRQAFGRAQRQVQQRGGGK